MLLKLPFVDKTCTHTHLNDKLFISSDFDVSRS